ncbi:hypothetical protein Tco_1319130 [Tanacetum coccineum]
MELVQDMSRCGENQKVKYTTGSLIGKALTWWNSQVQTRDWEAVVGISWKDFKTLAREELCPNNEMQKLETKFGVTPWSELAMLHTLIDSLTFLGQGCGNNGDQVRGRAFMMGAWEAHQDPNRVTGFSYEIEIASGQIVDVSMRNGLVFRHKAEIVCHEKVVRIPLPNGKILRSLEKWLEETSLIYYKTKEEDEMRLGLILELLKKEKLHVINGDGLHVDSSKIEAVTNWKAYSKSISGMKKDIALYADFLPIREDYKMDMLARLYLNEIIARHGCALEKVRFSLGKKGKLAPIYVGPFEITERIGLVAYRLRLPQELNGVHDMFHVSNFKKCLADPTLQIPLDDIQVDAKLKFIEELVEILEREFKKLKQSRIAIVKVRWNLK